MYRILIFILFFLCISNTLAFYCSTFVTHFFLPILADLKYLTSIIIKLTRDVIFVTFFFLDTTVLVPSSYSSKISTPVTSNTTLSHIAGVR